MAKLILIRGAMGAGKSTFAERYKKNLVSMGYKVSDVVICENDEYFTDAKGNYNYIEEESFIARKMCLNKAIRGLESNKVVLVANTFATRDEMKPYIEYAKGNDIPFEVYRCTGEYQNVHNVPEDIVINKRKEMKPFTGEYIV